MTLSELLASSGVPVLGVHGDAELHGLRSDSRACGDGDLFVAIPGKTLDSHQFLEPAAARGARAAIVHSAEGLATAVSLGLAAAHVDELSVNAWRLADAFYSHPTRGMRVLGVTGTNGKTTVAWLVRDMLLAAGVRAGYLGTLGYDFGEGLHELPNTTPLAIDLYNLLVKAQDRDVEALAIEVSSHALAERRADGVEFDVVAFTNLTQDHLDFHGSMEAYAAAKRRLFCDLPAQTEKRTLSVLNADDPCGRAWAAEFHGMGFGAEYGEFRRSEVVVGLERIAFDLHFEGHTERISAPLGGAYNVENLHAACACLHAFGWSLTEIAQLASQVRPVPGRFEPVINSAGIGILVDYAHTPDALRKLLQAVRPLVLGRLFTVFGAGGDRDRLKRPLMGLAAAELSDVAIVTSDNPRTEDPAQIAAEIVASMTGTPTVILDRAEAVRYAISQALPGDCVVLAGKGHEGYQLVGREKLPMDDRALARAALGARA